jgi:glycosyltransferase involved in cell wall biosynthesis
MSDDVEQVVPQRLVIVLPSTGAFDSRTWRIAATATERGHEVTVVARRDDGLPDAETTPGGCHVIRGAWDAVAGRPPGVREVARLVRSSRRRRRSPGLAGAGTMERVAAESSDSATPGATAGPAIRPSRSVRGRIVHAGRAAWRLLAIGLTVRSQGRATERAAPRADLVHAMAYMGIPVGLRLGRRDGVPVVYDARDIYVNARSIAQLPRPARAFFAWIERRWARRAARVITVNEPYAAVMAKRFGELPAVVVNGSPEVDPPAVKPRRFHEALDLPPDRRIVLYHGGFSRERGIEQLIDAIRDVPNATLVLLGYGELEGWLRERAAADASDRIAVLPAVPPAELIGWVASADVAAMPIQPTTLNHRLTTPNKLFEAIAADVPVVASDLPGMATIVRETGCGRLVDPRDPSAIAAAVRSVLDADADQRAAFAAGLALGRERYGWHHQAAVLLAEYERLTGQPW